MSKARAAASRREVSTNAKASDRATSRALHQVRHRIVVERDVTRVALARWARSAASLPVGYWAWRMWSIALRTAPRSRGRPATTNDRARNRVSPTVAPLSKVPRSLVRSPWNGCADVSRFLGQSPCVDWCERTISATLAASSPRYQASGFAS